MTAAMSGWMSIAPPVSPPPRMASQLVITAVSTHHLVRRIAARRQHASRDLGWGSAEGFRGPRCACIRWSAVGLPDRVPRAHGRGPVVEPAEWRRRPCSATRRCAGWRRSCFWAHRESRLITLTGIGGLESLGWRLALGRRDRSAFVRRWRVLRAPRIGVRAARRCGRPSRRLLVVPPRDRAPDDLLDGCAAARC